MSIVSFSAPLEELNSHHSTAILIPDDIMDTRPQKGMRAEGFINQIPFNLAAQSQKIGPNYFMVSANLRRQLKAKAGDYVDIKFEWVSRDKLEIPEELQEVLLQDEEFNARFSTFTVGKQRGLVHFVASAKNTDTRIKRALDLAFKVKNNLLHSDQNP